ncbi:MAG: transcription antitermination factor NusB, partial [Hyphomonadaceae bacterium]
MSARRAACDLVIAVLERGRALEDAMAQSPRFAALEGRDRAFARAIASATLRHLGALDAVLAHFLARPLPQNATAARAILRTGAAQILILETPAHAAVSESVALASAHRSLSGFGGLINAVLRKVAAEGPALRAALPAGADLPAWLYARWRAAYGDETAAAVAGALRGEPPLDLTVKDDASGWAARLGGQTLPGGAVRLPAAHGAIDTLEGFAGGAWWVQDAAAAMPARLLGDVAGLRVLDLCAAP